MLRATQPFFVKAIGVVKQAPPTLRSWSRPLTESCGGWGSLAKFENCSRVSRPNWTTSRQWTRGCLRC